jgi:diguanylate cyclase (GGDEF)-like protein
MLVDLDRFKTINDSLGHGVGDGILRQVAHRLHDMSEGRNLVARLGGDEFLILVHAQDTQSVTKTGQQIVERLRQPYNIEAVELHLAASVGITTYPFDDSSPDVLISHADEAMYDIKHDGGNGYGFFVPGTTVFTSARLQLENDLRRAAQRGELELHYQPQVEISTGRIVGLEALARWRHPQRGWIPPLDFIPLAEASDLIVQIGRWIVEEACRQARIWLDEGFADICIAINLSARQFRQPDLLAMIIKTVARHGLEPRHIVIELTEAVVMTHADRSAAILEELHRSGFEVAVDDFGTGYSSLGYLKQLPIGKLKIDRSFIIDLGQNVKSDSIVKAVVMLAHGLGMSVVAEGVETVPQLSCLREFACDQYQGYLYSRPQNATDIAILMRRAPEIIGGLADPHWLLTSSG